MVLSLRASMMESNCEQSDEDNDFLNQLRSFEKDNRRIITAIEIQKLEMEHKEFVMNYFMYHQQTNSVAEYERSFLVLKRWAETWNEDKFDEKWVVSIFVKGLKEEIKEYVKLYCLDSLQRAIVLAKWRELSFAGKVFDKKAERVVTHDESATNGIIDESRISFGISFNAAVNLNLDSMKLDNQAFETFCTNQQGLSIAAKVFDENIERNGYIISLDPDPPDDYGTTLIINESNFSIHLKSVPITFTSGYGVINCLMLDNFKVNGVLTCLFKAKKQVCDDKVKAKLLKEPVHFQLRKKYEKKKLMERIYVNEEFCLCDEFVLRFFNWYKFESKNDLVEFIKWVTYSALYTHLRVDFYVYTMWNNGRFSPWWLHFITGLQFRTEMKSLISKIYANESATIATSVNSAVSWVICSSLNCITNVIQTEMPPEYPSQKLQEEDLLGNNAYNQEYIMLSPGQEIKGSVDAMLSGVALGQQFHLEDKEDYCGIYGVNCPEWIMAMKACNRHVISYVLLYDSRGTNAVEFIINHTQVSRSFVQENTLPAILTCLTRCIAQLKTIVSFGKISSSQKKAAEEFGVALFSWEEFALSGHLDHELPPKQKVDICAIMYTSGTIAEPKGVIQSNGCFLAEVLSMDQLPLETDKARIEEDADFSFLPLAHIFDQIIETYCICKGSLIGFWQGNIKYLILDHVELKPTIFPGVPRAYDRIYTGKMDKTSLGGTFTKMLFQYTYNYKVRNREKGFKQDQTDLLMVRMVFDKIKQAFGGQAHLLLSGAAPLPRHVEEFLRVACCTVLSRRYGPTEIYGGCFTSIANVFPMEGTISVPMTTITARCELVPEMGYAALATVPRREIFLRENTLFSGYQKQTGLTKDTLVDGWFHTFDVGEWQPNGLMKIIDRKHNIFKLSQEEYVDMENTESRYSRCPLVITIWAYDNSFESFHVVMVVPKRKLLKWVGTNNVSGTFELLCKNGKVKFDHHPVIIESWVALRHNVGCICVQAVGFLPVIEAMIVVEGYIGHELGAEINTLEVTMNYLNSWCMLCLFPIYIISFYKICCAIKEVQIHKSSVYGGVFGSATEEVQEVNRGDGYEKVLSYMKPFTKAMWGLTGVTTIYKGFVLSNDHTRLYDQPCNSVAKSASALSCMIQMVLASMKETDDNDIKFLIIVFDPGGIMLVTTRSSYTNRQSSLRFSFTCFVIFELFCYL